VGVDSVGVDEGELFEGLFPVGGDGAFDESSWGFSLAGGESFLFGPFSGSLVFDVTDRQPQQLHCGEIVGEVASVLGDFAELIVERLDRIGIWYEIGGRLGMLARRVF